MDLQNREVLQESFEFWQQSQRDCEEVLATLLRNEFKEITFGVQVHLDFSGPDWRAMVQRQHLIGGISRIFVNARLWLDCTRCVDRGLLRHTLAHELIHCSCLDLQHGPEFEKELIKRGFEPDEITHKRIMYGEQFDDSLKQNLIKGENNDFKNSNNRQGEGSGNHSPGD